MKRWGRVVFFLFLVGAALAGVAQAAQIVAVQGEVFFRADESGLWQAASVGAAVEAQSQVQTKEGAQCIIAFDDAKGKLATVKENSLVRIDRLGPDEIFLAGGRVFSLIDPKVSGGEFRVKTPTAISGARGTAWTTAFVEGATSVLCVENVVFVAGVDASGQMMQETDLQPGFGVSVGEDGVLGDVFSLDPGQLTDGQANKQALENFVKTGEVALPATNPAPPAPAPTQPGSPAGASPDPLGTSPNPSLPRAEISSDATIPAPTPEAAVEPPADMTLAEPLSTDGLVPEEPMPAEDLNPPPPEDMIGDATSTDAFDMSQPLDDTMPPVESPTADLTQDIQDQTHDQTVYDQQITPPPPPPEEGGGIIDEGTGNSITIT